MCAYDQDIRYMCMNCQIIKDTLKKKRKAMQYMSAAPRFEVAVTNMETGVSEGRNHGRDPHLGWFNILSHHWACFGKNEILSKRKHTKELRLVLP